MNIILTAKIEEAIREGLVNERRTPILEKVPL